MQTALETGTTDEEELVKLALATGRRLGLTHNEIVELEQVAFLHDVEHDILVTSPALAHLSSAIEAVDLRWDAGQELPLSARIVTVCRAFLALSTDADVAIGKSFALAALRTGAGYRFCPRSVAALIAVVGPTALGTERTTLAA